MKRHFINRYIHRCMWKYLQVSLKIPPQFSTACHRSEQIERMAVVFATEISWGEKVWSRLYSGFLLRMAQEEKQYFWISVFLHFLRLNQGGIGTLTPEARREVASSHTDFHDSFSGYFVSWRVESQGRQLLSVALVIFSIQQHIGILFLQWHGFPSNCEKVKTMTHLQVTHSGTGRSWMKMCLHCFWGSCLILRAGCINASCKGHLLRD